MTTSVTADPATRNTAPVTPLAAVVVFFVVAYGIAWGLWLVLGTLADGAGLGTADFIDAIERGDVTPTADVAPSWLLYALTRVLDFSFTIAGVIVIAATAGTNGLRALAGRLVLWRIHWRWYALALTPVLFYGSAAIVVNRLEGGTPNLTPRIVSTVLVGWSAGLLVSLFLRGAMGEELGLRGFALPALQERFTPTTAALIVGVAWAGWHGPVLATRSIGTAVVQAVVIVGLSFLLTWLFNGSGGSLLPPLAFHATQNWEEGFEAVFPAIVGTAWETLAAVALLGLITLSVFVVVRSNPPRRTVP